MDGKRKLWMTLATQLLSTVLLAGGAWLGLPEETTRQVIDALIVALGIGVSGNIGEHITNLIKAKIEAGKALPPSPKT